MDKQAIISAADSILLAANNIAVEGEKNVNNMKAIFSLAHMIKAEAGKEDTDGGR